MPDATCAWCGAAFRPRRGGGSPQRFCRPAHRRDMDAAARRLGELALEAARLGLGLTGAEAAALGAIAEIAGGGSDPRRPGYGALYLTIRFLPARALAEAPIRAAADA